MAQTLEKEDINRLLLTAQLSNAKAGDLFKRRDGVLVRFKSKLTGLDYPIRFYIGKDYPELAKLDSAGYTKDGKYTIGPVGSYPENKYDLVGKASFEDFCYPSDESEKVEIAELPEQHIDPAPLVEIAPEEFRKTIDDLQNEFSVFLRKFKDARSCFKKQDWELAQLTAIKTLAVLTYVGKDAK